MLYKLSHAKLARTAPECILRYGEFSNLRILFYHCINPQYACFNAMLSPNASLPRSSTQTDRRHLLSDSVAPSSAASIITVDDGDRTPRAHSPAPYDKRFRIPAGQRRDTIADPTRAPNPYRGFPSEEHYLAALRDWADSKKFMEPVDTTLYGFYGPTSLQDYANKPPVEIGLKRKWKARKEAKREQRQEQAQKNTAGAGRRNTVT